jgi:hypothetical protein
VSVGAVLKNSRLMLRPTHIGVYLVQSVSCRQRTRETYFPTIPRIYHHNVFYLQILNFWSLKFM